jgi:hypothetical protein
MAEHPQKIRDLSRPSSPSGGGERSAPGPVASVGTFPSSPPSPSLSSEESYLCARGWERVGVDSLGRSVWADPRGDGKSKAVLVPAVSIPISGGGEEVVSQWQGPPIPWNYRLEEAVYMQQTRDREKESLRDQITRKEQELAALRSLLSGDQR